MLLLFEFSPETFTSKVEDCKGVLDILRKDWVPHAVGAIDEGGRKKEDQLYLSCFMHQRQESVNYTVRRFFK